MRERFECAVLVGPQGVAGVPAWARPALSGERLSLHPHALVDGAGPEADPATLIAAAALPLQRYDACLLPVEPATLPWARLALLRAQGVLRTPIIVLAHEVRAPALADLLALGVADFLRVPLCAEELRARLLRMAVRRKTASHAASYADLSAFEGATCPRGMVQEAMPAYLRGSEAAHPSSRHAGQPPVAGRGPRGHIGSRRFAEDAHAESQRTVSRPSTEHDDDDADLDRPPDEAPHEPFRQAKARVVEGFERDYLRQALQRHQGNVAQAARASSKHRRAFWALMRKYRIEAAPYRERTDA
ncbi:helix-turn-helix domain-containing protein [Bordetella genomosp. 13]|uniref:helix-turn-helix domain-containing protein n=1 Tax=Bordetella genomosp. 13 TaxID=463040 RepID=UPI0021B53A5E|nr:helix-turn-helix domain-containing protein [Bordetella genomosp. 13]